MKILFLTFYFKPDLCAGSFRSTALVRALMARLHPNDQLDVVTTLPNRYSGFSVEAAEFEGSGGLRVRRIKLPAHSSGMLDQSRAFLYYARQAIRVADSEKYDLVFASSSRLMTATLGARIARTHRVPLYLDLRDIFTNTMSDLQKGSPVRMLVPLLRRVERYTVRAASRINLAIPGFLSHFSAIDATKEYRTYTNGIDEEFLGFPVELERSGSGPIRILYAGNLGEGQGLHRVIPEAARLLGDAYQFVIIGDGSRRSLLEDALAGIPNVKLAGPMAREQLLKAYQGADILLMHLNDYPIFHDAIPSKLFEYGATGKPILAGVAGKTADFVRRELKNSAVFTPCDAASLATAVGRLALGSEQRGEFVEKYRRDRIMKEMADDIIDLALSSAPKRAA